MSKSVSVQRSNKAHKRLCAKHKTSTATLTGDARAMAVIKADYHDEVASFQANIGRVLSAEDKKFVFGKAVKRYERKRALNEQFNKK